VLSEGFSPQSPHAGEDARAPRMHVVLSSWFLVLGSGRPRSQGARGSRFSVRDARAPRGHVVLGSRFLVLGSWFLVPGSWFLVLGSRFGTPAHPGTLRIARMRARRPRSWHAQDCAYAGGTPAHPGGAWFSVIAGMVRDWCQAGSGLSYCCPPGPCHISGRETETTNSFATTSRRSVARASCSMSCLARNTPLPR